MGSHHESLNKITLAFVSVVCVGRCENRCQLSQLTNSNGNISGHDHFDNALLMGLLSSLHFLLKCSVAPFGFWLSSVPCPCWYTSKTDHLTTLRCCCHSMCCWYYHCDFPWSSLRVLCQTRTLTGLLYCPCQFVKSHFSRTYNINGKCMPYIIVAKTNTGGIIIISTSTSQVSNLMTCHWSYIMLDGFV